MGIKNIACLGETEGCHLLKFILPNQAKNNEIWKSLLYQIRNDKSSFTVKILQQLKFNWIKKKTCFKTILYTPLVANTVQLYLSNLIVRESQKFTKIESLKNGTEIGGSRGE